MRWPWKREPESQEAEEMHDLQHEVVEKEVQDIERRQAILQAQLAVLERRLGGRKTIHA